MRFYRARVLLDRGTLSLCRADIGLSSAMRLPPSSLPHVIESPKRLQIAVVEGDRLLFRVGQIERAQRFDVVDMPSVSVIPRHSRQEFRFEMAHKLGQ